MPRRPAMRTAPAAMSFATEGVAVAVSANTRPAPTSRARAATCAEVDCGAYLHGWQTTVDESTDLGQGQAHYIRKNSGRRFVESRVLSDEGVPLTAFRFEAGQRCFRADEHRARLERPEIYLVRDGDWRGNPRGTEPRRHASAADWVDDFANHQETLANRLKEG